MKIRILGAHNSESRNFRPACLLIDDILAIDAGGLTCSLTFEEQLNIKSILITHHHYDHIKDIPMLGMTFHVSNTRINIYGSEHVKEALTYIFSYKEKFYRNFLEHPPEDPIIKVNVIEAFKQFELEGFQVLPVPVYHSVPTLGFQITSPEGKTLFFTGDTGPGLEECWRHVSPDLLIIENTAADKYSKGAQDSHHLTPELLKQELISFRKIKGYLPRIVTVHMFPHQPEKSQIVEQLQQVSAELNIQIVPGYENMQITL